MTYTVKIWKANTERIDPISYATRYPASKIVNMLLTYALDHVRLVPTTATVCDIRFLSGSSTPSHQNTLDILPQLNDKYSGLRAEK